jgi:enoyl-CoA hydratase
MLRITIGHPPLNSMTPQIHTELASVFRDVSKDQDTRVVILTGSGDRGFCAGGDIKKMLEGVDDHARWAASMPEAREIVLNILECDKPVVCRVNGHAVGLGASIALCCDITVMVETAKIGDTHVKVGLVAGDGGSLLWPQLVGLVKARRYLLTGDLLTGREAADLGLITEAVPAAELDSRVDAWATRLGNGATRAIAYTKRSLNMAIRRDAQTFMDAQLGLETLSHLSEDHREAVTAFVNKREPLFTGR